MTLTYVATLEFQNGPPLTTRGEVKASTMPTCVARAARLALRTFPKSQWQSVVLLVERKDAGAGE